MRALLLLCLAGCGSFCPPGKTVRAVVVHGPLVMPMAVPIGCEDAPKTTVGSQTPAPGKSCPPGQVLVADVKVTGDDTGTTYSCKEVPR